MKLAERALLQERVKTLILGHALDLVLSNFVASGEEAGRDTAADLSRMEEILLSAARSLSDRASTHKLAVLVAVEDVSASMRTAFDTARAQIDLLRSAEAAGENGAIAA